MRQATLVSSLVHSAGGRLFGVFWGSLVAIDVAGLTHMSSPVAIGSVVLVVAVASWRQATLTVLAAAAMGWMFVNGFLVNHLGQLGWDGFPDLWRLLLVTAVATAAGLSRNLDGIVTRTRPRRRPARVRAHAGASDAADAVGRERDAVGR